LLKDEQVAELLRRYRDVLSHNIAMIKGNLRNADNRASQVWELIVLDAAAHIGQVEYESHPGASPDIKLQLTDSRPIWIEVAYLYPRFWQDERKIYAVMHWIFNEAKRKNIPPYKICPCLDAQEESNAGPILKLPELHKKMDFLRDPEIELFFKHITDNPNDNFNLPLTRYSIILEYLPHAHGPYSGWSGILLEKPQTVEEHTVYRVLRDKARQHDIDEPRIVCIGSDVSKVLSNVHALKGAILAAFKEHSSLSATIIVTFKTVPGRHLGYETIAQHKIFVNRDAKNPLTQKELSLLDSIKFNHWKYTWPLPKKETPNSPGDYRMSGRLTHRCGKFGQIIEVPTRIVIDSLLGKTSLIKEYRLDNEDDPLRILNSGWVVKSCSFKEADLKAGEASKIVFEFMPSDSLFHPTKPFVRKNRK